MKQLLILLVLFFYSNTALSNQNTGPVKITAVENWAGSESLFVWTDESTKTNPANCSYSGSYLTSSNIKDVFITLLLSANIANKKTQLTIYGDGCGNNRPVIVAIKILQ